MPLSSESGARVLPPGITEKEAKSLAKHFEDPKFRELFEEYAKEISDPKARAEQDAYLRQLEAEGQLESTYGKGVQVHHPQAGIVIKTKTADGADRVYINVCTCPKVDVLVLKPAPTSEGGRGFHLSLPNMLARKECRTGKTAEGVTFKTWDFIIHPDSLARAISSPAVLDALAIMAIEQVDSAAQVKLLRKYKMPAVQYKGVDGEQGPAALVVRTAGEGDVVDGRLRPLNEPACQTGAVASKPAGAADTAPDRDSATPKAANRSSNSRSGFSFGSKSKQPASGTRPPGDAKVPEACVPTSSSTTVRTPAYQIVERACVDLGQSWGDTGRGLQATSNTPQALIVRVDLPGVETAAVIQLDLTADSVCLEVESKYMLQLPLKYSIKEEQASAKFDVRKHQMTLTLPVLQQQQQQAAAAQHQLQQAEKQQHNAELQPQPVGEPAPATEQPEPFDNGDSSSSTEQTGTASPPRSQESPTALTQPDEPAAAPTQPDSTAQADAHAGKTQNQLLWESLHTTPAGDCCEQPAASHREGDSSATSAQVSDAGQQQEDPQPVQAVPVALSKAAPLRPRLSSSRVCASDFV